MANKFDVLLDRSRVTGRSYDQKVEHADRDEPVRLIPIDQIRPLPSQQRRYFDPESLQRLADSIRQKGMLQPILLRPVDEGCFEIVFGERRWRAAKLAGMPTVPAQVRDMDREEALFQGAIENLQREDVSRFEDVEYKLVLLEIEFGLQRQEVIDLLNRCYNAVEENAEEIKRIQSIFTALSGEKWTSFVSNGLPLLKLPDLLRDAVMMGEIPHSKAVTIARAPEQEHARLLEAAKQGKTVRELKAEVDELRADKADKVALPERTQLRQIQKRLNVRHLKKLSPEDRALLSQLLTAVERVLSKSPASGQEERQAAESEGSVSASSSPTSGSQASDARSMN